MNFKTPDYVTKIIRTLSENGFEAYMVGGCVRDILMGITPHDYDVTTNALPTQVKALFERTVDTGLKHGTVTVLFDKTPVEVTTYRTESGYTDNRRPDKVNFVSNLSEDLSRRDFTVNAICYNDNCGFVDLFCGIEDIRNKILRAVGDPQKRFKEDALRILRLFRFASTLQFNIEEKTYNDALTCLPLIDSVSRERIAEELIKASLGDNVSCLEDLINLGGLKFLGITDAKNFDVIPRLIKNKDLRFFSVLHLCECNPLSVAESLKLSNKTKDYIKKMMLLSQLPLPKENAEIKRILNWCDDKTFKDYIELVSKEANNSLDDIIEKIDKIISNDEPYKISQLKINGNDILELGFEDRKISEILNLVLERVILDPEFNEKNKLINYLKEYRN